MREIVLDTETTSTDAKVDYDLEGGCVDLSRVHQRGVDPLPVPLFPCFLPK